MISLKQILIEALSGIHPQLVVLMGLPASGKSTFINNELKKYFPELSSYHVVNSDNQVKELQYRTAQSDYSILYDLFDKSLEFKFNEVLNSMQYEDNGKVNQKIKTDWNWFKNNENLNYSSKFHNYYKINKSYYSNFFDIRDFARQESDKIFQDKIYTSGHNIIYDTVAAYPDFVLKRFKETATQDYLNSIIYLEIDPQLCIQRDEFRKKSPEARGVGANIINNYATKMNSAFSTYKSELEKVNPIVNKIYHFVWKPAGESPIKGTWVLKGKYFSK
jgi:GTPase SAR1 family protein